jgi:uncharacterized repeat protein (TIGR01451 family)
VATGTAVAGQYYNVATATDAVDGDGNPLGIQPDPATDESWYLAGETGLTVVKLTNGEDVTSAPGPMVEPGSAVTWTYRVTNTGGLDLTDVLVVDVDSSSNEVFRYTIPMLPAGATVELTATGTAIAGQYENTVIATAENPLDPGTELQAADTSWHYGCGRDRAAEAGVDRL